MRLKNHFRTISLVSFALAIILCGNSIVEASNKETVNVTIEGYLTISGSGAWANGINLSGSINGNSTSIATWSGNSGQDYLKLIDRTAYPGAYIQIYVKDQKFTYNGIGIGGTGLVKGENMYISTGSNPSIGFDDSSKNIDVITGGSCSYATTTLFTLNSSFYLSNHELRLGAEIDNMKLLFRSSVPCTNTARLFFNSIKLEVPRLATSGSYSNTLIFVVFDGIP